MGLVEDSSQNSTDQAFTIAFSKRVQAHPSQVSQNNCKAAAKTRIVTILLKNIAS